jgi:SAM-dependent methyltransferase
MSDRDYWDIRGRSFPGYREDDAFQDKVLETIRNHGVDFSGAHVLDLGCGAGSYALPFAKLARLVTALDISPVMLERVRTAAASLGINNIRYVASDWTDYEPREQFDILFCSRSPALKDPAALRKACASLSQWGILFNFAGEVHVPNTHTLGRALLERHGVVRNSGMHNFSILQTWLSGEGISFTMYPLKGERHVYYTLDEMTKNAWDMVEAAGAKPDIGIIHEYIAQFRDEASGKYLSTTHYDMELVIWSGTG